MKNAARPSTAQLATSSSFRAMTPVANQIADDSTFCPVCQQAATVELAVEPQQCVCAGCGNAWTVAAIEVPANPLQPDYIETGERLAPCGDDRLEIRPALPRKFPWWSLGAFVVAATLTGLDHYQHWLPPQVILLLVAATVGAGFLVLGWLLARRRYIARFDRKSGQMIYCSLTETRFYNLADILATQIVHTQQQLQNVAAPGTIQAVTAHVATVDEAPVSQTFHKEAWELNVVLRRPSISRVCIARGSDLLGATTLGHAVAEFLGVPLLCQPIKTVWVFKRTEPGNTAAAGATPPMSGPPLSPPPEAVHDELPETNGQPCPTAP